MRNLLALLLFVPSLCLAQVPDYVPTDGLVAWYPLDGDATDASPLGLDGTPDGTAPDTNRFGEAGKALYFDGSASVTCPSQNFPNGLTVSLWVQESEINGVSGFVYKYDGDYGSGDNSIKRTFAVYRHGTSLGNHYYATASETGVAFEEFGTQAVGTLDWVHLTAVFNLDGIQYYVNGVLDTEYTFNSIGGYHSSDVPITLGCSYPTAGDNNKLKGTLDDIGIWDRALTSEEIETLFSADTTSDVPDYFPSDGLIAWYPFTSSYADESSNGFNLCSSSSSFTTDRFGNAEGAYLSEYGAPLLTACNPSGTWPDAISYSVWFKAENLTPDPYPSGWFAPITMNGWRYDGLGTLISSHSDATCSSQNNSLRIRPHWPNNVTVATNCVEILVGEWYHLCVTGTPSHCSIYLNSNLIQEFELTNVSAFSTVPFEWTIGASSLHHTYQFKGAIDDVGIWGTLLTPLEVSALFLESSPVAGCKDPNACNYDAEANVDDGSCYSCNVPAAHCGPGTHWDETLSACVADVPSTETVETCTLMSLQELTTGYLNLLEIVAYQDSLLAAEQGSANDGNVDGVTDNWNCGDPLTYWDYDYATVLIGDQCWFAKNLRTETYANGDAIPELHDPVSWSTTTNGAWCIYDNDPSNASNHGFLYNWWVHSDGRNVCPSGWHTPTNDAFNTLLSSTPSGQTQAHWLADDDDWNGQNDSNFSMLPSGRRTDTGSFMNLGERGVFWGDEVTSVSANSRGRSTTSDGFSNDIRDKNYGASIRCLKD